MGSLLEKFDRSLQGDAEAPPSEAPPGPKSYNQALKGARGHIADSELSDRPVTNEEFEAVAVRPGGSGRAPRRGTMMERFDAALEGGSSIRIKPEETPQNPTPEEPLSPNEQRYAEQPARAIMSRRGGVQVQPADLSLQEPPQRSAPWFGERGVITNLPADLVASGQQAIAGYGQMIAEGERGARLEALSEESDPVGYRGSAEFRALQAKATERHKQALRDATRAGDDFAKQAQTAKRVLELITPEDMDTLQQGVWSAVGSSPPMAMGLALGIVTRSPWLGGAIAGGGGYAMQAGQTYLEAREAGASSGLATLSAQIQGLIELSDMLPVGLALKPASGFWKKAMQVGVTSQVEGGTEAIQQFLQDAQAMAAYNPDMTLGEMWQNMKVAYVAGSLMGTVFGTLGQAAQGKPKEQPAITEDQARSIREQVRAIVDSGAVMQPIGAEQAARQARQQAGFAATHNLDGTPVVRVETDTSTPMWKDARGTMYEAERAEPITKAEPNATWSTGGTEYPVEVTGKGREKATARLADGQDVPLAQLTLDDDAKELLGLLPKEAGKKAPAARPKAPQPAKAQAAKAPAREGAASSGETEPPPPRGSRRAEAAPAAEPPELPLSEAVVDDKAAAYWDQKLGRYPSEKQDQYRERLRRRAEERRKLDVNTDSLVDAIIKLGGLDVSERLDTVGDEKVNRSLPFIGYLFAKPEGKVKGRSLDGMAEALVERGYMKNRDPKELQELIRAELNGRKFYSEYRDQGAAEDEEMARMKARFESDQEMWEGAGEEAGSEIAAAVPEDIAEAGLEATDTNLAIAELMSRLPEDDAERLAMTFTERSAAEFIAALRARITELENAEKGKGPADAELPGDEAAPEGRRSGTQQERAQYRAQPRAAARARARAAGDTQAQTAGKPVLEKAGPQAEDRLTPQTLDALLARAGGMPQGEQERVRAWMQAEMDRQAGEGQEIADECLAKAGRFGI